MSAKYFAALAAARAVAAASSCSAATTTIQNAGDASALAGCSTFSGSIAMATDIGGNIALDGIQKITGSLIATDATELTQLSGDSLESIGDTFHLEGLTIMSGLNFPRLTSVETIDWTALAGLQQLSFTTRVQMANTVSIQNTGLASLEGIDLQVVDNMLIANNPSLNDINMQLGNITDGIVIQANGRNVSATFPNLIWANNMTLNNCSTVSIPSLESVNGSMGFVANFFESLAAPNLTKVGGSLSIRSNEDLTNISFPMLTTVQGGLQVANNTGLSKINGFPKVETVGGAVDCYGNFSEVDLPKLNTVKGAFNLQSTDDITKTCDHFSGMHGDNDVIQGTYTCEGKQADPKSNTDGSSSSDGSSTSSSAANPIFITGATGVLGVFAAMFGML